MFDTRRGHSSPSGPLWWFPTFSSMIFPLKSPLLQDNITKNITIFHDFWWFFPYIFHWYTDFVADSPLAMDDTRTRTYRTGTPEAFLLRPCATWCGGATTAAEFAAKHHPAGGNPWAIHGNSHGNSQVFFLRCVDFNWLVLFLGFNPPKWFFYGI